MHTVTWLLCLAVFAAQTPSREVFQAEDASSGQFSFRDGILEITPGSGWLRTPRIYSDFELSFEFRAIDEGATADVVLRAFVPERRVLSPAYRIALPQLLRATPATALRGPRDDVKVVREGTISTANSDGWQRLKVRAVRQSVTVTLNDVLVGEYAVERLAGYLLLTPGRGRVQMRSVALAALDSSFTLPAGTLTMGQVKDAKGRQPRVRREVKPFYSIEALHVRKVHGIVMLEAVVLPDGGVGDIRVKQSIDPDLDQSAVAALRQWQFSPGTVDDKPVPVLVEVEMTFAIGPPNR
jgi:TonB family protein